MLRSGLILVFLAALFATPAVPMLPTADDVPDGIPVERDDCAEILEKVDADLPLIIQIPDSDELREFIRKHGVVNIRRCLRKARGPKSPVQESKTSPRPKVRVGDIDRLYLRPGLHCGRPLPTKQEFLRMLKDRPADAFQILHRCNVPIISISPIRQLPVGRRQLPVDTRQRPVGTW